jgi:hypothetical protein
VLVSGVLLHGVGEQTVNMRHRRLERYAYSHCAHDVTPMRYRGYFVMQEGIVYAL